MARGYFENIAYHLKSTSRGMGVTIKHFFHSGKGKDKHSIYTYQYPDEGRARAHEEVSERHRGIHYLEPSLCIMCLLCAKVCPVQCIVIEGVRLGKEQLMSRFTIDYSKCLFCGLCTEPCPTDCIHHGREWDYSGYERGTLVKDMLKGEVYTLESHEKFKAFHEEAKEIEKAYKAEQAEIKKKAAEAKKKAAPKKKPEPKAEKPKPEPKAEKPKPEPETEAETRREKTRVNASETVQLPKPPGHDEAIDRARAELKKQAESEAEEVVISEIEPETVKETRLEPEAETLQPESTEHLAAKTDRAAQPPSLEPDSKKPDPPSLTPETDQVLEPGKPKSQKSSDSQALDPIPEDPEADLMK